MRIKEKWHWVLAFLTTMGISFWMNMKVEYFLDGSLAEYNNVSRFFIYCKNSLTNDKMLMTMIVVMMFLLISKVHTYTIGARAGKFIIAFSLLFSIVQVISKSYAQYDSWMALFGGKFIFIRAVVILFGMTTITYNIIVLMGHYLNKGGQQHYGKDCLFESWSISNLRGGQGSRKECFITIMVCMVICWLPYYVLFFPGTGNADTGAQILQYFHYPTSLLRLTPIQGDNVFATNHHPYFLTLLFGAFVELGLLLGKASYGVAIYCILQMVLTSAVFTMMFYELYKIGVSKKCINYGLWFITFFPMFPMHSICMLKDSVFSLICLLLTMQLFKITHIEYAGGGYKEKKLV